MDEGTILDLFSRSLIIALQVSAPMLLVSLAVGLIVSLIQTLTSIQESTLTFVPKLIAIFITLMLTGGWILTMLKEYIVELFNFSKYLG